MCLLTVVTSAVLFHDMLCCLQGLSVGHIEGKLASAIAI